MGHTAKTGRGSGEKRTAKIGCGTNAKRRSWKLETRKQKGERKDRKSQNPTRKPGVWGTRQRRAEAQGKSAQPRLAVPQMRRGEAGNWKLESRKGKGKIGRVKIPHARPAYGAHGKDGQRLRGKAHSQDWLCHKCEEAKLEIGN